MSKTAPEKYCALCWAESGVATLADVNWDGVPICRPHYVENHMRTHDIPAYPVDVTIDAPAMLQ